MTKLFFIILSLFFTFNAFAGGAKISELQKEAKADNDGKLYLEHISKLNAPHAINSVSLSDKSIVGDKSFRFEVNNGECGQEPKWSDCENERERSELYYSWKSNQFGKPDDEQWKKEKWYRFFVFIPKEHNILAPSQTSIIQWKRKKPSRVIIMFRYHHGGLYFDMNGGTFLPDAFYHLKYDKDMREQWTEILFNTNWHPDKDKGFMRVWIDGKMKIDYKGVANYKSKKELNLRFGMYSSSLDRYRAAFNENTHKKRVIYFDGVKGEITCEKLLNDNERCKELLSQKVKDYKIYLPSNWGGVKSFNSMDLKTYIKPLIKKSLDEVPTVKWDGAKSFNSTDLMKLFDEKSQN